MHGGPTGPAACRARRPGPRAAAVLVGLLVVGCEEPSPRILASHEVAERNAAGGRDGPMVMDEHAKVAQLINVVRASGLVFVQSRRELTAGEFGDHLLVTYRRHRTEIDKARDLIERGTRPKGASGPTRIRTGKGTELEAREWLHNRLDEIEAGAAGGAPVTAKPVRKTERKVRISDVLAIVDHSDAQFIVPQRKGPAETMSADEFSAMLRQKWEWLGNDIEDVDAFVREIASESFTAFEPYLIQEAGQDPRPVREWLLAEVEKKREALATAQVGSP